MRNEIQKMESNVSLRDHMICYLYQSGDPCLVQQDTCRQSIRIEGNTERGGIHVP